MKMTNSNKNKNRNRNREKLVGKNQPKRSNSKQVKSSLELQKKEKPKLL